MFGDSYYFSYWYPHSINRTTRNLFLSLPHFRWYWVPRGFSFLHTSNISSNARGFIFSYRYPHCWLPINRTTRYNTGISLPHFRWYWVPRGFSFLRIQVLMLGASYFPTGILIADCPLIVELGTTRELVFLTLDGIGSLGGFHFCVLVVQVLMFGASYFPTDILIAGCPLIVELATTWNNVCKTSSL